MLRYSYKVKNEKGEERSGVIFAKDKNQAAETLRQRGYFLLAIESKDAEEKEEIAKKDIFSFFSRITLADKLFFTRTLAIMIRTGVPLPRAFEVLSEQTGNKKFKAVLKKISEKIVEGVSVSEALKLYPKIFSDLYIETIKVGEETGKMEESLDILTVQMEREHNLRSQVKSAMIYPIVVLTLGIVILVLMMIFVVPKLLKTFQAMNVELPATTRFFFSLVDFITKRWLLSTFLVLIIVAPIVYLMRSKKGSKFKSYLILKTPKISTISKNTNSALFLRILSSLLSAGVPIVRALEVAAGALSNYYFKESLEKAASIVKKGNKLSEALEPYKNLYPPTVIQMLEVGEETGTTAEVFKKLAEFYEEEVSTSVKRISSVIEPFLIILLGTGVGFFAISMLKPMFSVMTSM